MRSARLLPLALAAAVLAPAVAGAKPWQGIQPGQSTGTDVMNRFGEPSSQRKLGARTALVYREDRAPEGTRQAQFLAREDGVVVEVNVFPATKLDKDAVEGTYGKGAQKTFTDDFRPAWMYRALGVIVFFDKDGFVDAIRFLPPEAPGKAAAPAPSSSPREPVPNEPAPAR
jgi:hypothetical protein